MKLSFKVLAKQVSGRLDVDVRSQTPGGFRPVRIWLDGDGRIKAMNVDGSGFLIRPAVSSLDSPWMTVRGSLGIRVDYPVRWKTGAGLRFQQGRKVS